MALGFTLLIRVQWIRLEVLIRWFHQLFVTRKQTELLFFFFLNQELNSKELLFFTQGLHMTSNKKKKLRADSQRVTLTCFTPIWQPRDCVSHDGARSKVRVYKEEQEEQEVLVVVGGWRPTCVYHLSVILPTCPLRPGRVLCCWLCCVYMWCIWCSELLCFRHWRSRKRRNFRPSWIFSNSSLSVTWPALTYPCWNSFYRRS